MVRLDRESGALIAAAADATTREGSIVEAFLDADAPAAPAPDGQPAESAPAGEPAPHEHPDGAPDLHEERLARAPRHAPLWLEER
jgi:hypothetical protein